MAKGIVRKFDELGRITIPVEMRRSLGAETGQAVSILLEDDDSITIKKVDKHKCALCEKTDRLLEFNTKHLCFPCLGEIKEKLGGK